jgi:hypothetical protein
MGSGTPWFVLMVLPSLSVPHFVFDSFVCLFGGDSDNLLDRANLNGKPKP